MTAAYSGLRHAQRIPPAAEIHSQPFLRLEAPEAVTHLPVYAGEEKSRSERGPSQHALLAQLCGYFGLAAPTITAKRFVGSISTPGSRCA